MSPRTARRLLAAASVVTAAALIVLGVGVLGHADDEYRDSPVATYLLIGGAAIGSAVVLVVVAYRLVRSRAGDRPR